MDRKRRKLLGIFAKCGGALGMGAAGAVVGSVTNDTAKPFLGSGEGFFKIDRYEKDAQEEIDNFMAHYEIPDPDKAKELYRKIITEMGLHGTGGGVTGVGISRLASTTFGRASVAGAFSSILVAPWIAEGVARASHETFLDEGKRVPYGFDIIGINQETFSLDQTELVMEYGMSLENASRLCDDCQKLSYSETSFAAGVTSIADQALQWASKTWSKRKEAVAAKEAGAGDADFSDVPEDCGPEPGEGIVIDADFQEIKMDKNGEFIPVDRPDEPLP